MILRIWAVVRVGSFVVFAVCVVIERIYRRRLNRTTARLHKSLSKEALEYWSVVLDGYHGIPVTCLECRGPLEGVGDGEWRCPRCGAEVKT